MKVLAIVIGLGFTQVSINEITGFFPAPQPHLFGWDIEADEKWECSSCHHTNSDWTSICGKCGRSKR